MNNLVQFENRDGIGILRLSNPDQLNVLDSAMVRALTDSLIDIRQMSLKVLIVTGEGKAFVAGASIKEMSTLSVEESKVFAENGHRAFHLLEAMPWPTIAMINGFALGGGSELALACDLRFASERAKLGQPEVTLGICPGYGGTQRLARLIGPSKAMDIIFTGRIIPAAEALAMGWVDRVYPADTLEAETLAYAESIRKNSAHAIVRSKAAIRVGLEGGDGYQAEIDEFAVCFAHPDQREGMTAFLEKRPPVYK